MTISVACDTCGRSYQLKDGAAGKKVRCKDCDTIMSVPELNDQFDDYDDDPWGNKDSSNSNQSNLWDDDDEWSDTSGGYSVPAPYTLQSSRAPAATAPERRQTPRPRKRRPASGSSGDAGKLIAKIAVGAVVAILVMVAIPAIGKAIRKAGLGGGSWTEFKPPGTPFAVQMPGKPKQSSQFQAGISITQFMVELRGPERAFGLMHAALPLPVGAVGTLDQRQVDEVFRESKQGLILGVPGAQLHSESKTTIQDTAGNSHPGVDLTVTIPHQGKKLKFTYRLFLVGTRMVIVLAGSEERNFADSKDDVNKFLNSFKVTQPVTSLVGGNSGGATVPPMGANNNGLVEPASPSIQPPNAFPPPSGINPDPGGAIPNPGGVPFNNPGADINRRMQEDAERRRQESIERMERFKRESEQRRQEIQNRMRRPPGFP